MRVSLGDVLFEYSLRNKQDEDISVYSVTNTKGFCKGYFSKDVSSKDKKTYKIVPRGYFAYNPSRINVGSIDYLREQEKVIVSPLYVVFGTKDSIDKQFLLYFLKSEVGLTLIKASSSGSVRDILKFTDLRKFNIELPDIEEQRRRASVLTKIDNLIIKCTEYLRYCDNLVKSRFIELFGDLSINPMKWPVMTFREFAKIDTQMIHNFSGYYEYPHIGIECIEKDTGVLSSYRTIKDDHVVSGKYWFTGKHIIYSKIRPNLNKVALPSFDGLCSADAYPILPKETVCSRYFLAYVMRSKFFLDYILAYSNRTNLPKVNKKQVEGFECPIPPLNLQKTFELIIRQVDKSKYYRFKFISLCRKIVNIEEEMLCQTLSF